MASQRVQKLLDHLRQPDALPVDSSATGLRRWLTSSEPLQAQKLVGKCAIVTGAGGGIGQATSKLFAQHGAKVVCADLDLEAAEEVVKEINEEFPGSAKAIKADVSKKEDNIAMIDLCIKSFGRLDIFFANAGILRPFCPIKDETEESFMHTMQVNSFGTFLAIKYASEAMKTFGGGSIIATASIAAIRADLTPLQYAASKGAVMSLITSANDRLLLDNIRVNAVMPGGVMTNMMIGVSQNLDKQGLHLEGYDARRFPPADPMDVAKLVAFLASDDAVMIKGQAIVIDGGMSQSMGSQPYPRRKKSK